MHLICRLFRFIMKWDNPKHVWAKLVRYSTPLLYIILFHPTYEVCVPLPRACELWIFKCLGNFPHLCFSRSKPTDDSRAMLLRSSFLWIISRDYCKFETTLSLFWTVKTTKMMCNYSLYILLWVFFEHSLNIPSLVVTKLSRQIPLQHMIVSRVSHVTHYLIIACELSLAWTKKTLVHWLLKMTSPRKTNQCSCKHTLTSINYVHSSFAITWLLLTLEQGSIFVAFLFPLYRFHSPSDPVTASKRIATNLPCKMESFLTSFAQVSG